MLKDATYKAKFAKLNQWMPAILDSIKKDLRNEHLSKDRAFVLHYFAGKNPAKLTLEELVPAYSHSLASGENAEDLGEFITNRWLLKHSDLYHYFEEELSKINPNFHELEVLENKVAANLMEKAVEQFGAPDTYLFCVLNSVVFPEETFKTLSKQADQTAHKHKEDAAMRQEHASVEAMHKGYEQQIARLTDKYEKKILGLQKKYTTDVDSLKKQVSTLQRKLNA